MIRREHTDADVVRRTHVPDGLAPEFPCPAEWGHNPIVVGCYVGRRDGTLPVWIVVTWDHADGDAYHLARLLPDGTSTQTRYHVGSSLPLASDRYAEALRLAWEESERKNRASA